MRQATVLDGSHRRERGLDGDHRGDARNDASEVRLDDETHRHLSRGAARTGPLKGHHHRAVVLHGDEFQVPAIGGEPRSDLIEGCPNLLSGGDRWVHVEL